MGAVHRGLDPDWVVHLSMTVEAAEAFCSAFYRMPFTDFLGEDTDEREWHAWFHVGNKPKDMRVTIARPHDREAVLVRAEWRNYHADPRNPLKGEQTFSLPTYAVSQHDLRQATEDIVVKVLELYRQVLLEEGVAGDVSTLQETPEEVPE